MQVMLIDFADKVNITVQSLGHTFLALCQTLHLELKLLDPSLYIDVLNQIILYSLYQRFAARLEFGRKEMAVASTALRLVQRMSRDWIQIGRRPAGICGAGFGIF